MSAAPLSLILELREKYQKSRWGLTVEEQKPITEEVFSIARKHGIPDHLIFAETEEMFTIFTQRLNK